MNLITGANGFLGSHLCESMRGVGIIRDRNKKTNPEKLKNTTILYGDFTDLQFLRRVCSDYEIDTIFHVGAQSIVRIANTNPLDCYRSNVMGTINVLECAREFGCKVIYASSDKAYGDCDTLPYTEETPLRASDPYSTSKLCGDMICQSYFLSYGVDVRIVRSANIYGPDPNHSRIIPNTIRRILDGKRPQIYTGSMNYKREYVYIEDVVSAYHAIDLSGEPGEAYNIGREQPISVKDLVDKICSLMGYSGEIEIREKQFREIENQYLYGRKLMELDTIDGNFKFKYSLERGLKKTIKWYSDLMT